MSVAARLKTWARGRSPRALLGEESGLSAIEFGLLAPMLFFSLLAATDIGFAINDRITLDHVLRAGAQVAMTDQGVAHVQNRLQQVACESYSVETVCVTSKPRITSLAASSYCICPTTGATDVSCTSTCGAEPNRFYRLSVQRTYTPRFLPTMSAFNFAPAVLVEVR